MMSGTLSLIGQKYISYDQYKKNNFIQGMPTVGEHAPVVEGTKVSTYFRATGNISMYPHRGMDFSIAGAYVYPIFANDTSKGKVYETAKDLDSYQGRHVDVSTKITYTFKGQQRTDAIVQRMLHLKSAADVNGKVVTINSVLGVSGNTGMWNGKAYPLHLHTDLSTEITRSPWLDQLTRNYESPKMSPYEYSKKVYYDPNIFLKKYNYPAGSNAYTYSNK